MLFTALCFFLFNSIFIGSPVVSGGDATPIRCGYPCQPEPPSPPSEPVYKSPPPPPPPVYKSPPPPVLPSCPPPPRPPMSTSPVYGVPPPPQPPTSTSPVYGVPPPPPPPQPPMSTSPVYGLPSSPPSIQGGCPPMQNCVYPSPNTNIYQPTSFASHLHIYFLNYLVLMFLFFLLL